MNSLLQGVLTSDYQICYNIGEIKKENPNGFRNQETYNDEDHQP